MDGAIDPGRPADIHGRSTRSASLIEEAVEVEVDSLGIAEEKIDQEAFAFNGRANEGNVTGAGVDSGGLRDNTAILASGANAE